MSYRTRHQLPHSFFGVVTVTARPGSSPGPSGWQVRLSYRSREIIGAWGGQVLKRGAHFVVVQVWDWNPGRTVQFVIYLDVDGRAAAPSGCWLNGDACRVA